MKNKYLLLLLVTPFLFSCGNKKSGYSSQSSTTTTNTNTETSDPVDPVEPDSFFEDINSSHKTLEEYCNIPTIDESNNIGNSSLLYGILGEACDNMSKATSVSFFEEDWYVNNNSSIYVPGYIQNSSLNRDSCDYLFYDNAIMWEYQEDNFDFDDKTVDYGNSIYGTEYEYYLNDNKCNYVEEYCQAGNSEDYVYYSENPSSLTEEQILEKVGAEKANAFSRADLPNVLFNSYDTEIYNFDGNTLIIKYETNDISKYDYYVGEQIDQNVNKICFVYIENVSGAYVFTKIITVEDNYFLQNIYGEQFDRPMYSDLDYVSAVFTYNDVGEFKEPERKEPIARVFYSHFPILTQYEVVSGEYKLSCSYTSNSLGFIKIGDKYYDRFIFDLFPLDYGAYYVIGNDHNTLSLSDDDFVSGYNVLKKLSEEEKGYTGMPESLFAFESRYDVFSIILLVDCETNEVSVESAIVF